jgi:hypothetical protein
VLITAMYGSKGKVHTMGKSKQSISLPSATHTSDGEPRVTDTPSSADIAEIDAARVVANTGDIAEWNATVAKAEEIHDRAVKLATLDYTNTMAKANVWGVQSPRGAGMVAGATEKLATIKRSALRAMHNSVDEFAITGGFLAQVGGDNVTAILGRKAQTHISALLEVFNLAGQDNRESITTTDGRVLMVASWVPLLETSEAELAALVDAAEAATEADAEADAAATDAAA